MVGSDEEFVPNYYFSSGTTILELPEGNLSQDFYEVVVEADTIELLALNTSKVESELTPYSEEEINEAFGTSDRVEIQGLTDADSWFEAGSGLGGNSLWKYALILALAFVMCEILLIRLMK